MNLQGAPALHRIHFRDATGTAPVTREGGAGAVRGAEVRREALQAVAERGLARPGASSIDVVGQGVQKKRLAKSVYKTRPIVSVFYTP